MNGNERDRKAPLKDEEHNDNGKGKRNSEVEKDKV